MMKKTFKKVVATVLSATMIMSMAMTAFADDPTITPGAGNVYYTNFETVIVPTSFNIGMNPQKLTVTMPDTSTSAAQVLVPKIGIVNTANRDKNVEVKFTPSVTAAENTSGSAISFKDSESAVGNGIYEFDVYLSVNALASGQAVQLKSGSATELQPITEKITSGDAVKLADVSATTTTSGAVTVTASGAAMKFNLIKSSYSLASGESIELASGTANDMSSKYELAEVPTGAVTAFEITGKLNEFADWSKIGNSKVKITPTYKITDVTETPTIVEGTANLISGAGNSNSSTAEANAASVSGTTVYVKLFASGAVDSEKITSVKINDVAKEYTLSNTGVISVANGAPSEGTYAIKVVYNGITYTASVTK